MTKDIQSRQPDPTKNKRLAGEIDSQIILGIMALVITTGFIDLLRPFLGALILAAISAVLSKPVYQYICDKVGGRIHLASALTVLFGALAIIVPGFGIGILAVQQSAGLIENAGQFYANISQEVDGINQGVFTLPDWVPFKEEIAAAGPQILEKADKIVDAVAVFLVKALSGLANGTASFLLSLFTFLYAMFYFLPMEKSVFQIVLASSGLRPDLQDALNDRIVSVSRATFKGTLMIGVVQGALGGVSFWAAGIQGAAFWSVVMAVVSVIPGIGAAFVVLGGAIYLAVQQAVPAALALAFWAVVVVGLSDNILRPILVGRDAKMPDLLIFVSTLGGLAAFGVSGLIFGPVLAGLFLTIWRIISEEMMPNSSPVDE